ncbi:hypothetical protein N9M80_03970 [Flavobacteriales bacterium]|nr:hypothetical protein [Flavobacteriales bacterium]
MIQEILQKTISTRIAVLLFCAGFSSALIAQTCADSAACNYDAAATTSTNCKYAGDVCDDNNPATVSDSLDVNCNCAGVAAIVGCLEPTACNYLSTANSPGPCLSPFTTSESCWACSQTIGQGTHGDGKGILVDNDINKNGVCDDIEIYGCMNAAACNHNSQATSSSAFPNAPDPCIIPQGCDFCGIMDEFGIEYFLSATGDTLTIDASGNAVGGTALTQHKDYILLKGDKDGNDTCDILDIEGCTNSDACNYNVNATIDDDSCIEPGDCGCDGSVAKNMPAGDCDCSGAQLDSIGTCILPTDPNFCTADINNNLICDDAEVLGCMDSTACNYNASANVSGPCYEVDECGTCGGDGIPAGFCDCAGTTADTNANGICDNVEVSGCLDKKSCNFSAAATLDVPSSCLYEDECGVCGGSGKNPTHCNCDGDIEDAVGVCGGRCGADIDGDGICDDIDPCLVVGEVLNTCKVCVQQGTPNPSPLDCGCRTVASFDACGCTDNTPDNPNDFDFTPYYSELGKECDGTCTWGSKVVNGQTVCIVVSGAVPTVPVSTTLTRMEGNNKILETDPFAMERWVRQMDTLHARMTRNLDDGSLGGYSDSLTIEKSIVSNGILTVLGNDTGKVADIGLINVLNDSVNFRTNVHIQGWLRVLGTNFSDGGIETTTLGMSGDLNVGGHIHGDSTLTINTNATIHDSLLVGTSLRIGYNNQVVVDSTGNISASQLDLSDTLSVSELAILKGGANIYGDVKVNNNGLTIDTSGNIAVKGNSTVNGNDSIGGNLTVAGELTTKSNVSLNDSLTVKKSLTLKEDFLHTGQTFKSSANSFQIGTSAASIPNADDYSLVVDGKGSNNSGIAIRVNAETARNSNKFVTFMNSGGTKVGEIIGERQNEFGNQKMYAYELSFLSISLAQEIFNQVQAGKDVAEVSVEVATYAAAGVAAVIPGAGLTDVDVAEGVAEGVAAAAAGAKAVIAGASLTERIAAVAVATSQLATFKAIMITDQGVTYATGSGDYAEWLLRENLTELYIPGQIVGVRGGKISLQTDKAEELLIISTAPAILGNQPENVEDYEQVAFLGQVPVRVLGSVNVGDYILPSGDNDGYGIAVSPADIRLDEIADIVAVAWEDGASDLVNVINASIGLDGAARKELVTALQKQMDELRVEYNNGFNSLQNQITSLQADLLAMLGQQNDANTPINSQALAASIQKNLSQANGDSNEPASMGRQPSTSSTSGPLDFSSLSLAETERICQEQIKLALEQAATITKADEALSIEQFAQDLASIQEHFLAAETAGRPNITTLMPSNVDPLVLEITADIAFAALNIITHPENLRPSLRNALRKQAKQLEESGMNSEKILVDYAEGSPGEELLLKKSKEVATEQMLLMYPYMKRFQH